MDYIFYDTETTGISPYFDQILQFAAIRTDEEFNEIDRFEIRCRLLPHILANPGAMNVTKISADELINPNLPTHYEMMMAIRERLISWQPAIILGQNTLAFDEPMLRSDFYQNLLPTYLTNTNGNKRMDSLPILQATSILAPDAVAFPINEKGNKSFKLDLMAPTNGFDHQNAHEAMSDVEATIFMCGLVRNGAPHIWGNFLKNADKIGVHSFTKRPFPYALIRSFFGKVSVSPVATIGIDPKNRNEVLVLNLAYCPEELNGLSDVEIIAKMSKSPKPILTIRANAMPSVWSLPHFPELSGFMSIDVETLHARALSLNSLQGLRQRLSNLYLGSKTEYEESPYVERQIYSGFPSKRDENLMAAFHKLDWEDRWPIVQSFSDERFQEIGERLIFNNSPLSMPEEARNDWEKRLYDKLFFDGKTCEWLTIDNAIHQAQKIKLALNGVDLERIEGHLEAYYRMKNTGKTVSLKPA